MTEPRSRDATRQKVVAAAAGLLHREGPAAVTTRGAAAAAGVQAPTIYRLFGDKDGLLEAVAEHVMSEYVATKTAGQADAVAAGVDPLDSLRHGWDAQIDFALANPAVFRLLSDPERVAHSAAARSGRAVLAERVRRVAVAGRLQVSERRAVDLIQAAGIGVIQVLLATPPAERDPELPAVAFNAVLSQILTDGPEEERDGPVATAVALKAQADQLTALSETERALLAEWLDRAVRAGQAGLSRGRG